MGYDILLGNDDDEMGDITLLGDEYDALLGARRRRVGRGGRSSQAARIARALVPRVPGQPAPGAREYPLPFPATAFTATSGTSLNITALPQKPFKGLRMTVALTRTGATATGLVTINRLDVGTDNQLVAAGNLPADMFAPTAFQTTINMSPCTPGIAITVGLVISAAPAMTDRVDIAVSIIGLVVAA